MEWLSSIPSSLAGMQVNFHKLVQLETCVARLTKKCMGYGKMQVFLSLTETAHLNRCLRGQPVSMKRKESDFGLFDKFSFCIKSFQAVIEIHWCYCLDYSTLSLLLLNFSLLCRLRGNSQGAVRRPTSAILPSLISIHSTLTALSVQVARCPALPCVKVFYAHYKAVWLCRKSRACPYHDAHARRWFHS